MSGLFKDGCGLEYRRFSVFETPFVSLTFKKIGDIVIDDLARCDTFGNFTKLAKSCQIWPPLHPISPDEPCRGRKRGESEKRGREDIIRERQQKAPDEKHKQTIGHGRKRNPNFFGRLSVSSKNNR
ncbi:hypothetical protein JTE90_009601 [Oedothorax gibbosus]|uniref:Uncharacterized protein n=1 Tax=Oedothorax gibbosus TaxID=931172 RepID=A0AAV6VJR7_9ARAC|nr:hypothetical protein JTE90_009601 [Oedothorax gibbosus]